MKLTFFEPRRELKPFVHSIWVLESPVGLPASDTNLAAPNGCSKLIFSCENSITSIAEGRARENPEQGLYFIGTRDISVLLRTPARKTGFIGIEFHPHGAYPIFGVPMSETVNRLLPADDLFARWGRHITELLCNLQSPTQRIACIQDQLVGMLRKQHLHNPIVEYCVNSLRLTHGLTAISDLERRTGYSRRYLEMLFKKYVGFSPKVLGTIFRFQRFYRRWAQGRNYEDFKEELYDYYYDQAHFVKEFKSMTGFTPQQFTMKVANEFGRQLSLR